LDPRIKYDGYRLRLERDGDGVRLITRNSYDWTKRYP
jgi:bifunctional non-homologous end joining protein LigD